MATRTSGIMVCIIVKLLESILLKCCLSSLVIRFVVSRFVVSRFVVFHFVVRSKVDQQLRYCIRIPPLSYNLI